MKAKSKTRRKLKSKKSKWDGVNISSTFFNRCVCKYCGTGATDFGAFYKSIEHSLPIQYSIAINKAIRKNGFARRVLNGRSSLKHIVILAYRGIDCSIPVSVNKGRGAPLPKNDMSEYLRCECGKTCWYFDQVSVANKKEIVNRKGRYCYPKKFA